MISILHIYLDVWALDTRLDRTDAQINALIEENRVFRESQQLQLAAIIGNGRRIDRLEQQAS